MLLSQLRPASFRGARFLVPQDEVEEGRNAICHEYPDASQRYMEDNGYIPPRFTITAILHGQNLPSQWARLRSALITPGPGVLKHPWYGTQLVQVDGTFRVSREDKRAGTLEIEINLAVTGGPVFPGILSGIAAVVTGLASAAVSEIFTAFTKSYGSPGGSKTLATVAAAVTTVSTVMRDSFGQSTDAPARMIAKPGLYVRAGDKLGDRLVSAFRDPFEDDTVTDRSLVRGFKAVAAAGASVSADAAAISATTADLAVRKRVLALYGASIQAAAFACLADSVSGLTYSTADEVEGDEELLTSTFEAVQATDLDGEIHAALWKVYTAAADVLRDASVRLPRVMDVALPSPLPASVLVYSLYDSEKSLMSVVDLNLDKDPVLMPGSVTVLRQVA